MQVLEVGCVRMAKVEGQEGIAVIDCVEVLTFHELLNVVLDDRGLMDGSSLSSGGVDTNAVTKSKDVLKAFML
jgi:hypothetical protein